MKTSKIYKIATLLALALGLSQGVLAVTPTTGTASTPISNGGITPYIIPGANPGGNRTCSEVGSAYFGNAIYYSCRSGRIDAGNIAAGAFNDVSGNTDCARNDIGVTVTEDKFVSFTATPDGIGAAIVKGSDDANTYVYDPQSTSDSGLASPVNSSGNFANLSNLTFCWNPVDQGGEECFTDETAWAAGTRYVSRGNWATYTSYSGVAKTVTLFAGQTYVAGTVNFSVPVAGEVTITITLNPGFRFALDPILGEEDTFDNNVKVQDYATPPPAVNPAPGLFAWKKVALTSPTTIKVPVNNFYGVHVDVERQIDCPEPESEPE